MFAQEHRAELAQPLRRMIERGQDDRPLVDRERKPCNLVGCGALEPDRQLVGAGPTNQRSEVFDGVVRGRGGRRASSPASLLVTPNPPELEA